MGINFKNRFSEIVLFQAYSPSKSLAPNPPVPQIPNTSNPGDWGWHCNQNPQPHPNQHLLSLLPIVELISDSSIFPFLLVSSSLNFSVSSAEGLMLFFERTLFNSFLSIPPSVILEIISWAARSFPGLPWSPGASIEPPKEYYWKWLLFRFIYPQFRQDSALHK